MDKTYETYEFLPANSTETEADQFFVVQDDGTFLLNRQQIQYVAQVQDVKEVLEDVQPCTVYGVSSQQFFVDVDNSAELISVSDQFILPEDNTLYANSFLLQPSSSTTNEQIQDVVVDQYKEPMAQDVDIDVVTHNSKQGNNFTEITLSDEQYQTLEQKGWILLESNDKIFVLNTLGLHDITTNDKLIQKLRNELQTSSNTPIDTGTLKTESISNNYPNVVADPMINQQETVEFVVNNENEQNDNVEKIDYCVDNKDNIHYLDPATETLMVIDNQEPPEPPKTEPLETLKKEITSDLNTIKIKTKFNFKDIPEKIVLGKTVNGKRLVAKVVKPKLAPTRSVAAEQKQIDYMKVDNNGTNFHEIDFVNLVQTIVRMGIQNKFNHPDYLASAETVVSQLLKVPNIKASIIEHNLIITKITNNKDEYGNIYNRSKISLITGRVAKQDGDYRFEHLPNLLQSIKSSAEEKIKSGQDEPINSIDEKDLRESFTIFHIHIAETKCVDNIVRVSVNLNKRQLPLNLVFDLRKRYPSMVFACSACAALFKSEHALTEHQMNQCMDTDDALTIDTDNVNKTEDDVIVRINGNETVYSCGQCDMQSTKLDEMQIHIKTHHSLTQEVLKSSPKSTTSDTKTQNSKIYKCKMCPNVYFYPSTLSKHIMNSHIKVKKGK